jgi:Cu/Ag efflux protein CusF
MKRAISAVMTLAISVILVIAVMAAEQKAPGSATPATPKFEKYSGVVEKVDVAKKDFSVKSGKEEMTFSCVDKTRITEGKKDLTFADLKKGLQVTVKYIKDGGKLVAAKISVRTFKPAGAKETAPSSTEKK